MNVQKTYKTSTSLLREMVISIVIACKITSLCLGTSIGIALKNDCVERDTDAEIVRVHRIMDLSTRAFCRAPAATNILVSLPPTDRNTCCEAGAVKSYKSCVFCL
jgi:hypothetical protein